MAEYRLSPRAQRDLGGIYDYTVERWGLQHAENYTDHRDHVRPYGGSAAALTGLRPDPGRLRNVEQHAICFRQTDYDIAVIPSCTREWTQLVISEPLGS